MNLDYSFMAKNWFKILEAVPTTLALTIYSMIFALLIAVILGGIILKDIPVLRNIVIAWNSFIKGIPLIVQLLFCYNAMPLLMEKLDGIAGISYDAKNLSYFSFAIIAFAFNYGAYMTDVIVTARKSVPDSQMEAALSIGMTKWQALVKIVVPQAFIMALPNLSNYFMWLLKATSIASVVNVKELLATSKILAAEGYQYLESYIIAAAIYWIICILAEKVLKCVQQYAGKYNRIYNKQ